MGTVKVINNKKRQVQRAAGVKYELPTERSSPVKKLGGYTILLFGRKKIGKTCLASQFPNAMFLMFEPGGKALSIYQESMTSWRKFVRFVDLLIEDKKFNTVVLDTVDFAYDSCLEYVCSMLGIDHPADAGYGKGWNAVKQEFIKQLKRLMNSGKGIIFISHQKEKEIEDRRGRTKDVITNAMTGQGSEIITGLVDMWFNYDFEGRERILTILGDDTMDAGHRVKERFRYTDSTRIRKLNLGKSEEEAYEIFVNAFNNQLDKPEEEKDEKVRIKVRAKTRR